MIVYDSTRSLLLKVESPSAMLKGFSNTPQPKPDSGPSPVAGQCNQPGRLSLNLALKAGLMKRRNSPAKQPPKKSHPQHLTIPLREIGALLRREGLYSSALTQWRRQYQSGALQALKDDKRGRKRTRDAREKELERLQRENERLNKKLRQAELIIEIQKKVAAMLGNPIETPPNSEGIS